MEIPGLLKVYGYAASINVRKVLWMCEELGLPFEREDWGGGFRSTSQAAFRALNPVGMVPVIDDDGVVVWESNVILRYLASKHVRNDLLPSAPAKRARIEQWMDWQASDFNNSWRVPFQALVRKNPQMQDPVAIKKGTDLFVSMMGLVEEQLSRTGAYIAGPHFTLADIPMGLAVHRWYSTPFDKPTYRNVARYYGQLLERPGFKRYGRDGGP
jgi:glutathione S-transferase